MKSMERDNYEPHPSASPLALRGLETFFQHEEEERTGESCKLLSVRRFSFEDTGIPEHTLKRWHDADILWFPLYDDDGKQSKISVLEMAWLSIVDDLFRRGHSMEFVQKVAADALDQILAWKEDENDEGYISYDMMEVYFWLVLKHQIPAVFIIFDTGRTEWLSFDEYVALWDMYKQALPFHLMIPLNQLAHQLIENGYISQYDPTPTYCPVAPVTAEELQVLRTVREGNYQKMTLHIEEGKIESLEGEETIPVSKRRVTDLLKDNPFQDIQLKTSDGKLVHITRTVKKRLR